MVHSPSIPEGSKSETREERLKAKLLKLSVEEPEIMRDIDAAEAKWRERLRSARADFLLQAAGRRKASFWLAAGRQSAELVFGGFPLVTHGGGMPARSGDSWSTGGEGQKLTQRNFLC